MKDWSWESFARAMWPGLLVGYSIGIVLGLAFWCLGVGCNRRRDEDAAGDAGPLVGPFVGRR
jgi:hypothetical protein